jgi:hypothetical protein
MPIYRRDVFSLADAREVHFQWPTDLRDSEASAILKWLATVEEKIIASSIANEWLRTANANSQIPPAPAGGKE